MQDNKFSDVVRSLRDLTRRVGRTDLLEAIDSHVASSRRDRITLVFAGGTNAGKSKRINALLERDILPVSPRRSTAEISIWAEARERVVIDGETERLAALDAMHRQAASEVEVALAHDWLEAHHLCLVERPALDASDEELEAVLGEILSGADAVVHLIHGLMPISHLDAALLNECARRELPVILAISHGNQLSAEDRSTVLQHVERHVAGSGLKAPVIDTEAMAGVEDLRGAIDGLVDSVDFARIRLKQSKEGLLEVLGHLELAARAGIEAQESRARESRAEHKRREQGFERQDLAWTEIEQCLDARRLEADAQVRRHLERKREAALENLSFGLERSRNVSQWWHRELPYRLQGELKGVSHQVSRAISDQVTADVRWLREELRRQFGFPLPAVVDPAIPIDDVEIEPSDITLADMRSLRIASRIGTAATVILAGLMFTQASIGGMMLAASSMSGVAADQIATKLTDKDRSAVRAELDRLVQQVWLDRAEQVSAGLKHGYGEIIVAMKKEQENWRESQKLALDRSARSDAEVDWQQGLEDTQALAAKMMRRGEA